MTTTIYDPDLPKTAEEIELENIIRQLAYRLRDAQVDSAAEKMILRQLEGIRHSSEIAGLIMEEYDMSGIIAVNYWW